MAKNTKIEWADHTFNPWIGCTKIAAGCTNCYAEIMDKRTARGGIIHFGPKASRRLTSESNWKLPFRWNRAARKRGTRAKVFCASMADIFDDHPSIEGRWQDNLFFTIGFTTDLDWLLLTKRPQNIRATVPSYWLSGDWPQNAWIGTSVEDQEAADTRIPALLECPAPIRFLSVEPMLGPIVLPDEFLTLGRKGWVICGGESGPKARPVHPDWVRSLRDQCVDAGVTFFFKQWGEWQPSELHPLEHPAFNGSLHTAKFADGVRIFRIGKKAAGRMLDGREWNEMPGGED